MKVFWDTSALIAYFVKQETHHEKVVNKYNFYKKSKAQFITSNYIIDELLTWFSSHQTKHFTQILIEALEKMRTNGEIKILYIDEPLAEKAISILLKFFEHKISFTDATTYILYKDFAIDEIFTLDRDFKRMRAKTSF